MQERSKLRSRHIVLVYLITKMNYYYYALIIISIIMTNTSNKNTHTHTHAQIQTHNFHTSIYIYTHNIIIYIYICVYYKSHTNNNCVHFFRDSTISQVVKKKQKTKPHAATLLDSFDLVAPGHETFRKGFLTSQGHWYI